MKTIFRAGLIMLIIGTLGCSGEPNTHKPNPIESGKTCIELSQIEEPPIIRSERRPQNETADDDRADVTRQRHVDPQHYGSVQVPKPLGRCAIVKGVPKEGLGTYLPNDDVYQLGLTFKMNFLDCDHEGPSNQFCSLRKGGYVTWLEEGQRRHIIAEEGDVHIVIKHKIGIRC
ncbi:hypothetical protein N9M10_01280 [Hellea sp.]|nr:hypothetical protein [Hellea sp.]